MRTILKTLPMLLLLAIVFVASVDAQSIKTRFDGIIVDHDADIAGDLNVTGAATLADITLDGVAIVPFVAGDDAITTTTTIAHTLGTTPTAVLITPQWNSAAITQTTFVTNVTASSFDAYLTTGSETGVSIFWQVIK